MQALSPRHGGQIYQVPLDLLSVGSSRGQAYPEVNLASGRCYSDQSYQHPVDLASMTQCVCVRE